MSEVSVPFGNLKLNYLQNKTAIDQAIVEVLERGWFILGEAGRQFEEAFAGYCGASFGIGVGSGTEALHLALLASGVKPGDEVITVANTCVPTLSAISFAGAVPVLVDINPETYTMDPEAIEDRITSRTKVILPVHLYGQCADMDPICAIAHRHGLKVVEDCAQAHGARYLGRVAGTMGEAGCYSFYPSKNLGAYGDAGMVVTQSEDIRDIVKMARNYGEKRRYYHSIKGFNSRMDEMQAAILLARLPHLDEANERRRYIASRYNEAFEDLHILSRPLEAANRHHVYHLYVVQVPHRDDFQDHLRKKGVGTLIHYPIPIHRQESYAECRGQGIYLMRTDEQAEKIASLPLYPEMTDEQVDRVISAVVEWARYQT